MVPSGEETISETFRNFLCRFTRKPLGVIQPTGGHKRFMPCPLLNKAATLPSDQVDHEAFLDGIDKNWKTKESRRKCLLVVDNCFPMWIADPEDTTAPSEAKEPFWNNYSKVLNAEAPHMWRGEYPRTDAAKWM